MKAPAGSVVTIYFDGEPVSPVDVIETSTGRHYWVLEVRLQKKGKHAGRQHLACLVLGEDWATVVGRDPIVHTLRWYKR